MNRQDSEKPTCGTCVFFRRNYGDCRRHPPVYVSAEGDYCGSFRFPETHEYQWCGEHPDFPAYVASTKEAKP